MLSLTIINSLNIFSSITRWQKKTQNRRWHFSALSKNPNHQWPINHRIKKSFSSSQFVALVFVTTTTTITTTITKQCNLFRFFFPLKNAAKNVLISVKMKAGGSFTRDLHCGNPSKHKCKTSALHWGRFYKGNIFCKSFEFTIRKHEINNNHIA